MNASATGNTVEFRLREIERMVAQLEKRAEGIDHNKETLKAIIDDIADLKRVVKGDPDLGVPSVRAEVNDLVLWKKRIEWTAYVLATVSGGSLLGAIKLAFFP